MNFSFEIEKGLYISYPDTDLKESEFISEFEPFVVEIIQNCNMQTMDILNEFIIAVRDIKGRRGKEVCLQSLHNISYFKMFNCPDGLLTARQRSLLEYKLQQEASRMTASQKFIYPPGLYGTCDNEYVFSLGDQLYFSNTDKNQINQQSAFRLKPLGNDLGLPALFPDYAKEFINFFPGVSEILFYGSLLGIVKPFLAEIGIPMDFIISVIGKSGSMKTSLARKYALWLDTPEVQEENFQSYSYMSDILSRIDHMQGLNFLIDDLHNVYGSQAKNRQSDRLDKLTRHICTNSRCANVIITGESMDDMAIFSAFDRMFQVTIFQMKPDMLQNMKERINRLADSFMAQMAAKFTEKLMSNYKEVLDSMNQYIKTYKPFGFELPDTRIARHILILRLTESLYRTYMCNGDERLSCKNEFESSLQHNAEYQQKLLIYQRKKDENINYVKAVYECLTAQGRYIKMCTSEKDYLLSDNSCFYEKNYIYITAHSLTSALSLYLNVPVSLRKAVASLRDTGLLDTDADTLTKKKFGKRHYKINYELLENANNTFHDIF